MSTIECTWQEFKQMAKEFHDTAPTLDMDELENAWKCLSLGYLGMKDDMWLVSAGIVLQLESKTKVDREIELLGITQ